MEKSDLTNIHIRKIIAENVIFHICTCQNMYNKKTRVHNHIYCWSTMPAVNNKYQQQKNYTSSKGDFCK